MHDQPSASSPDFGPRPPATSVSDFYDRAYCRAGAMLMTEIIPRILSDPEWEEDALSTMLEELNRARAERFQLIAAHESEASLRAAAALAAKQGEAAVGNAKAHIDRVARIAAEIAGINTLFHWGWIKDEHLTRLGQQVIDRAGKDEPQGPTEN